MQQPQFEKIFDKYADYSKKIKEEFIDVDKSPFEVDII